MKQAHKDMIERIIAARVKLLLKHPFFGMLAIRLEVIPNEDVKIGGKPTMGTDGYRLYFHPDFVKGCTDEELVFVIGHEVLHCVYLHMARRNGRRPIQWNQAADYAINYELVKLGVGKLYTRPDFVPCYDTRFADMCADEIYDILEEEGQNSKHSQLDYHFEIGNNPGEAGDGEAVGMPDLTDEEAKALKDAITHATLQAAGSAAGNLPGGVARLIKQLTEPQIDWRDLLVNRIKSTIKNDFTFARPSRRSHACGAYLPGMLVEECPRVALAIDTSGSISEHELQDMLAEVAGITEQYSSYELHVWCFDTKVHNYQVFTAHGESVREYKAAGGGGTHFACNWKFMQDNEIEVDQFVMFTDGYDGNSGYNKFAAFVDTVFVVHGNPGFKAPFGVAVPYAKKAVMGKKAA